MLSADIVPRMHAVRPDRVYGTGVLAPIDGFQPVENAQLVARRFTALWPPRVTDMPVANESNGVPSAQTATSTAPISGFGAAPMGLLTRFRIWRATRQMDRALRGAGFGSAMPGVSVRGPAPSPTSLPVVGGWAPTPSSQESAGFQISAGTAQPRTSTAPALQAQQAMAMMKTPGQRTAQSLIAQFQQPGVVGARAAANSLQIWNSQRIDMPWGR